MTGTAGQKRVPADWLRASPVPVPESLDEQERVVARIDSLFAEIDAGEAALAEARAGVETYRKSLLKAAVTGELTADWRRRHPPRESGTDLLRRILAERRARWQADPRNARKTYVEPAGPDTTNLPELPEGWVWANLDQLIYRIEAGLNVKAHGRPPRGEEVGILKVSAVTWDEFDEDESKALFEGATYDERNIVKVGDFLLSRANTVDLVGAPVVVERVNSKLVLSDKVLRLIVGIEIKWWLYFFLKSPLGRGEVEKRSSGNQLSMRNISQENIREISIPIPPLEEMNFGLKLLRRGWLEKKNMVKFIDNLHGDNSLRQSILAAAFRGELVR